MRCVHIKYDIFWLVNLRSQDREDLHLLPLLKFVSFSIYSGKTRKHMGISDRELIIFSYTKWKDSIKKKSSIKKKREPIPNGRTNGKKKACKDTSDVKCLSN